MRTAAVAWTWVRFRPVAAVLALGLALGLAAAGAPAPVAAADPVSVSVTTMPLLPNATLRVGGATVTTDASGSTTIQVASIDEGLPEVTVVDDGITAPGRETRFSRWWGLGGGSGRFGVVAVFDVYRQVTWQYVELDGRPVDAATVDRLVLRSSHGNIHDLTDTEPIWLHATRAVPSIGGLVPKNIDYRVESVTIDGAEVVIRNQQKFVPAISDRWTIELLFYDARFTARDALLGVPTGAALALEFPSGRIERHALDAAGQLRLRLPRGAYRALVDAPGMGVWTPVSVSRDQEVPITVLTYLDMALVGSALAGIALGLLLVGRPHLLAPRRRSALARMVAAPAVARTPCRGGCPPASPVARYCRFCGTPRRLVQTPVVMARRERR